MRMSTLQYKLTHLLLGCESIWQSFLSWCIRFKYE